jgi:hypothetical protein
MKTQYSQIGQDVFVIQTLKQKTNGLFLDIGSAGPTIINNTYLLEKKYNWTGISIDLDKNYETEWKNSDRNSKFLIQDALTTNYDEILSNLLIQNNKDRIDYLSMDLEPPEITLQALYKLPLDKFRFSVITFEHDFYRNNLHLLEASREHFNKFNYKLVVSNIANQEDWWIDSTLNII